MFHTVSFAAKILHKLQNYIYLVVLNEEQSRNRRRAEIGKNSNCTLLKVLVTNLGGELAASTGDIKDVCKNVDCGNGYCRPKRNGFGYKCVCDHRSELQKDKFCLVYKLQNV